MHTPTRLEQAKHIAEFVSRLARPSAEQAQALVRPRKAGAHHFADDGQTPNNPVFPLVHYRSPVGFDKRFDPAALFERLFFSHGWRGSWRDGIYPYNHFHTGTHEVLGIARGQARVLFGGKRGRHLDLKTGDVVVIPAGVGHRRRKATSDLLVVGAYPVWGHYDEPRPRDIDGDQARAAIRRVKPPLSDPVYGKNGPLLKLWRRPS